MAGLADRTDKGLLSARSAGPLRAKQDVEVGIGVAQLARTHRGGL